MDNSVELIAIEENIRRLNRENLKELVRVVYPEDYMERTILDINSLSKDKLEAIQDYLKTKTPFLSQQSISTGQMQ